MSETKENRKKRKSLLTNAQRRAIRGRNKREMKLKMAKEKKQYIPTTLTGV